MAIDKKAQEIAARINKSLGAGTVILGSEARTYPRITSGSLGLDYILGGGWPVNQWHEIVGESSAGKALALDTPIPTPTGWTTMKALEVGDEVFDETGRPCLVTFVTGEQHGRMCYRMVFSDGSEIVADADHQWTLFEKSPGGRRKQVTTTTREMVAAGVRVGPQRFYRYHMPTCQPLQYPAGDALPITPYTLGAWLGDGTSADGGFTSADPEIVEMIRDEGYDIRHRPYPDRPYGYYIRDLVPALRSLDLIKNKHIPGMYLKAPIEDRISLLAGIVDTDGYIDPRGHIEVTTVSERLAADYFELIAGLGHKVHLGEGTAALNGRTISPKYRLAFQSDLPVARLSRKASKLAPYSARSTYYQRTITAIEPVPSVPVKCIQVDSPHSLYLAGTSCIPTHNTNAAFATIAANQERDPNWVAVWVAAEEFNGKYADMCGVDRSRVILIETNIMEEVYDAVLEYAESRSVDGIFIDSLPALIPSPEDEKDMDESTVGRGALLTGKFFRKAGKATKRSMVEEERPVTGFIINQYRMKIGGYGDPRTTPGGEAKNYAYFTRVEVKRDEWIEVGTGRDKDRIGQTVKARTLKNKSAPPYMDTRYNLYFEEGGPVSPGRVDHAEEIVTYGILLGLLDRAGAWYSYGDHRWQGKDAVVASVREEVALAAQLEAEVMAEVTRKVAA